MKNKMIERKEKKQVKKQSTLLIATILIILLSITIAFSQNQASSEKIMWLSLEKQNYYVGEKITIIISSENPDKYDLSINSPLSLYKYSGELTSSIDFYPKEEGLHAINLEDKNTRRIIQSITILVSEAQTEKKESENQLYDGYEDAIIEASGKKSARDFLTAKPIFTDKQTYFLGEPVTIRFNLPETITSTATSPFNLYYEYAGMSQKYMGEYAEINFLPRGTGTHHLVLRNKENNLLLYDYSFEVIEKPASPVEIKDSSGIPAQATLHIYFQDGSDKSTKLINTDTMSSFSLPTQNFNLEIMPQNKALPRIILKNVNPKQGLKEGWNNEKIELGLEQVHPLRNPVKDRIPVKSYAIDPTKFEFESAEVIQTAVGEELWKCKDYDFSSQKCFGTWEFVMNLTPGEQYTFVLTPEDPLYTETRANVSCSCQASATSINGVPARASCSVWCPVIISVPSNAETGYLMNMSYGVSFTITGDGAGFVTEGNQTGRFDRDEVYLNGNDASIGSATSTSSFRTTWINNSLNPTGNASFNHLTCNYWNNYCTWYVYLYSTAVVDAPGTSDKSITINITLLNMSYTWNYTLLGNLSVKLNWPNAHHLNYYNITFNYTPTTTSSILNCTLYTNRTGSFTNENTSYSITNNQSNYFNITFSSDGNYIWNVLCADNQGNIKWAPNNYTFTLDTLAPNVNLESPANWNTTTSEVITFYYNVTDINQIANCSLIVDNEVKQTSYTVSTGVTQSFMTSLTNGLHTWMVLCYDLASNAGASENRTINVSATRRIWTNRWYETSTSNYYNQTALISLDNQTDETPNWAYYRLLSGTGATLVNATSPYIGGDGAYIPANTNITFRSAFSSSNTNIEASWHLYILKNNGSRIEICYSGDDAAEGTPVTAITTNSCSATSEYRLTGTDRLLLVINIYNVHPSQAYSINHTIDSINSYVEFTNFITLGHLQVDLTIPTTNLTLSQNEVFNMACNVSCVEGTCLNTSVYAQYNTSTQNWASISSSGNIILNGTETNPHNQGNLSSASNETYFWLRANQASTNNIRCFASSKYSNATGTTIRQVFIGDTTPPDVNLTRPNNMNYTNSNTVAFYFRVYDASGVQNCSLIINNSIYTTKNASQIINNAENNFTVDLVDEGSYLWTVNCTDTSGYTGTDTPRTLFVDLTNPWIMLNAPAPFETIGFETVNFNWTAYDNYANTNLTCDLYINGTKNQSNIISPQGVATNKTVTGFKVGAYTWYINCSDASGRRNVSETRSFIVEDNSPLVYLVFPPNNHHNNSEPMLFLYNASDNNGFKNCTLYLDGKENQTSPYPVINNQINNFTVSGLSEGLHNWTVMCIDTGDLAYTAAWRNFTIDRTPPNVSLLTPLPNATLINGDVSFTYNATDNLATSLRCELFIDGNSKSNDTATSGVPKTVIINNLADGLHYWNVSCLDNATNPGNSETRNLTVNETPSIILGIPAPGNYTSENVTFTYTPSDNDGFTNCTLYLDSSPNSTNYTIINNALNQFTIYKIAEGYHTWFVECFDNGTYLNRNVSVTRNFTVDLTPPSLVLNYPEPEGFVNSSQVNFNFTASDNYDQNISCDLYVNGLYNQSAWAENGIPKLIPVNFTNGRYNWSITCRDDVGNINTSETRWFNVSVPPSIELTYPYPDLHMNFSDLMFEYIPNANNALANCTLFLDGKENQTNSTINQGTYNYFWINYAVEGIHNWSISCADIDGLRGWSETRYFYLDFHAPTIVISSPGDNTTITRNRVIFNFTAFDSISPNLSCNVVVNGAPYGLNLNATNSTPYLFNYTLPDGNYSWYVECRDKAGNYNMSDEWNFTIIAPPNVTLIRPPNNYFTNSSTINLTYLPEDDYVIPNCSLYINGSYYNQTFEVNTNANNTFTVTGLSQGRYNWTVYCTDQDGNTFAPPEWNFTIDQTPPGIKLISPEPDATLLLADVMFNFTATDNLDTNITCEFNLNGSINRTGISVLNGSYYNFTNYRMNDGLFFWNITCWDTARNTNASATRNFAVAEPPRISLGNPAHNYRTNNVDITFFFTPNDNSGSIASCTLILNGEANETLNSVNVGSENNITLYNLPNGTYVWTVNCTDINGNKGTNESAKTLYIDLTGPTIILYQPLPDETFNEDDIFFNWTSIDFNNTSITCNLTVSDPLGQRNAIITALSGSYFNTTIQNLSDGLHFWNVTCWDDLGNNATSETRNFSINQPDLLINPGNISFSNTNPDENETIRINATIHNIGGRDASNVVVSFWDGLPEIGSYLGNDTISVNANSSSLAQIEWNITLGYHTIWIVVDPDNLIPELDETNNNASKNISILRVYFNSPQNMTFTNDTTPIINFTMQDFTGGIINYTILVDNTPNGQAGSSYDGESLALELNTLSEGRHSIKVTATDAIGRKKNSTELIIIIDTQAPIVRFETQNSTWFNTTSPIIYFNITDSADYEINYSLFINNTFYTSGASINNTRTNTTLNIFEDGKYNITIQAIDEAGNSANYSIIIYVDTTKPSINLIYPDDGANFITNNISLNFTVTDNLDTSLTCNLTIDGIVNKSNFEVNSSQMSSTVVTGLREGTHYWNVTCWDNATNTNTSETRSFNIFIPPIVKLVSPPNNTITNNAYRVFVFNVSDDTGITNCSLLLNGQLNNTKPGNEIINNAENNFTLTLEEGLYEWRVECYDNTSMMMKGESENRTLIIDLTPPQSFIMTPDESWFNTSNPNISFRVSDNFDLSINYTFYVNGSANTTGIVGNNTLSSALLHDLNSNASFIIILQASDDAGNSANSTGIRIYIDTVKPSINLSAPLPGEEFNSTSVQFNFTPADNMASYLMCNLTISNGMRENNINASNGVLQSIVLSGFSSGTYYWNVTCLDLAGNRNTSETLNFTIRAPDLMINSGNISFNETSPEEGKNITIYANIYNTGGIPASNVIVQFWREDPGVGGVQINGNITIPLLINGENTTINITYSPIIGSNNIFVILDPPLATNGSIIEENETNNKANKQFSIGLYQVYAGNTTELLKLEKMSINRTIFEWSVENATGSNIFVTDIEATPDFNNLQAVTRDINNVFKSDDFSEIDARLGSTNYTDSVNNTFASNGIPKETMQFTVFTTQINDVPVINSTNTTNFKTGILWDKSDGGIEYNGTQDIVFISEIKKQQEGGLGIYDFEIKVPALLRNYNAPGATVAFYYELK